MKSKLAFVRQPDSIPRKTAFSLRCFAAILLRLPPKTEVHGTPVQGGEHNRIRFQTVHKSNLAGRSFCLGVMPIPCPHFKITIVKRSQGQSAVAGAAYQSGERLFSEYDQKTKFYNKKKELVHAEIMLPSHAPPGYADRATLWNAVEAVENQWNSQLARRIVLAFPVEVPKEQYKVGDLAKNFALSFMLIVFVMTIYVPAGIILLIADLLLIPGLWLSFRMVQKYGKEKNDICSENVSSIVEYVSGIQTFRAYGVGGMKNKTVINAMREFSRISFVYEAKVLPIGTGFGILSWLSCPLVIWLAYTPWAAGTLNTVDYLLICMLPLFCAKLANSIFVDLTSYKNLMISKNKILGVMNEPEETGSMEPLHTTTHEIIFDNVDFSYVPGEPVLKHATFTVPDQKLTAIVGDSGSGKSTILNLIAKYYEATGGTISIGGKPINHVAAERVLEQVSMVDQDVFLFDDTIRDNIRHARPNATDAEIEAACREANCDSFIRKMEKGYDTLTGENGNLLSGGERQRISIARAILKNSPILLLDEATASLDIENELAVKQAIANLLKEKKTVVMIAHTLSIVKNADQILVMGDGRIAESGTHEELLAKGGKYAAMWNAEQKISA